MQAVAALLFLFATQRGVELSDVNTAIDPCTDFYEYANGTWRANNPIPASQVRWSRRWAGGEVAKDRLKLILDEVSAKSDWPKGSVEQLIGDHYAACTNEAQVNALGAAPVQPLLKDIDAIKEFAGVQKMIGRFHDINVNVPFGLASTSDNHNPTQVIATIYAAGLGLPDRDYYLKTEDRFVEARAKYLEHLAKMFQLIGTKAPDAKAAAEMIFALEKKLAKASLDNVALRDPVATDHKTTFEELQKLAPKLEWSSYFKNAQLPAIALNVTEPKFLEEVNRQLGETPIAAWKTYLKWHLLNSAAASLNKELAEEDFEFNSRYLAGAKEMKPRWKRCVESTDSLLGEALGQKYTAKYFPPEAKARMQDLVKNLLSAMGDTIRGLKWMGPATKKKALEKLGTFNSKIGYPDKWKDYSKVQVSRASFWDDVVAGRRYNVDDHRAQIGKPVDRGRWGMTPPTSNAYYNALLNEIVFPAGILQSPAFSTEVSDAVNYGAIGVMIGHEISHGFDDQGAQYDAEGKLKNWWTDDDLKKFKGRTGCVKDQFEGYFIEPGIHHNGSLVLGESIGDLAGAKIAYLAFKKTKQGRSKEKIDGYTPDQQFFVSWGQFRGDAIRPERQRMMIQGDPHPTGKYRVMGPLSNLPEFARAFSCKDGAAMVRPVAKRCEVW